MDNKTESPVGGVATMPTTPETNGGGLIPEPNAAAPANPLNPLANPDTTAEAGAIHQQMVGEKTVAASQAEKKPSFFSRLNPFSVKTVSVTEAAPAPATAPNVLEQAGQVAANAEATGGALPTDGTPAPAIETPPVMPEIPPTPPVGAPTTESNSSLPDHLQSGTTPDMPHVDDAAKAAAEGPDAPKFGANEQSAEPTETTTPSVESANKAPAAVAPALDTSLGASTTTAEQVAAAPDVLGQAEQITPNSEATDSTLTTPDASITTPTVETPTASVASEPASSAETTDSALPTPEATAPAPETPAAYQAPAAIPEYHPPVSMDSASVDTGNPQTPSADAQAQWPQPGTLDSVPPQDSLVEPDAKPAVAPFSNDSLTDKAPDVNNAPPLPLEVTPTPLPGAQKVEEPVMGELQKSENLAGSETSTATVSPEADPLGTSSPTNPDQTGQPEQTTQPEMPNVLDQAGQVAADAEATGGALPSGGLAAPAVETPQPTTPNVLDQAGEVAENARASSLTGTAAPVVENPTVAAAADVAVASEGDSPLTGAEAPSIENPSTEPATPTADTTSGSGTGTPPTI